MAVLFGVMQQTCCYVVEVHQQIVILLARIVVGQATRLSTFARAFQELPRGWVQTRRPGWGAKGSISAFVGHLS